MTAVAIRVSNNFGTGSRDAAYLWTQVERCSAQLAQGASSQR